MDRKYWEDYYARVGANDRPSDFAQFCAEQYDPAFGRLVDIGCGDGRDTLFFASAGIPSIGIDQSKVAITGNEKRKTERGLECDFLEGDFTNTDFDVVAGSAYSVYSRFTLHSIDYAEETRLFNHLLRLRGLQYVLIEARSVSDSLYGTGREVGPHEYVTSHYRRFIDPAALRSALQKEFHLEYFEESNGFAKTATEDPCLIRLMAKRVSTDS